MPISLFSRELFILLIIAFNFSEPSIGGNQTPLIEEKEDATLGKATEMHEREEGEYPKENGERQSNGIELENGSDRTAERQPDVVDDHPGKSRFTFHSFSPLSFFMIKKILPDPVFY